jgi:hypothetical protein
MDWNYDPNLDEQGGRGNPRNLGYMSKTTIYLPEIWEEMVPAGFRSAEAVAPGLNFSTQKFPNLAAISLRE